MVILIIQTTEMETLIASTQLISVTLLISQMVKVPLSREVQISTLSFISNQLGASDIGPWLICKPGMTQLLLQTEITETGEHWLKITISLIQILLIIITLMLSIKDLMPM